MKENKLSIYIKNFKLMYVTDNKNKVLSKNSSIMVITIVQNTLIDT
jgi:hypothetical protein